jgi:hypothetical protein
MAATRLPPPSAAATRPPPREHALTAPQPARAVAAPSRLPLGAALSSLGALPRPGSVMTCVLRMRGIPFSARKADVVAFFAADGRGGQVLDEDSIHLVLEPGGRPAGVAFVEFASVEEARAALASRNRKSMGSRYVELFASSREEATRVATTGSHR